MKDLAPAIELEDIGCNDSRNTSFDTVLQGFLSRRLVLRDRAAPHAPAPVSGGRAAFVVGHGGLPICRREHACLSIAGARKNVAVAISPKWGLAAALQRCGDVCRRAAGSGVSDSLSRSEGFMASQ